MRRKNEAVLCFESNDDGSPKVVRDYRARYRAISQVLDDNPEILSPTYHFTSDGMRLSRYYEERLSGIKMRERQNKTHLAQVRLWADLLQGQKPKNNGEVKQCLFWDEEEVQDNRQPEPYTLIRFDPLLSFDVDFGIEDAAWLPYQEVGAVGVASGRCLIVSIPLSVSL